MCWLIVLCHFYLSRRKINIFSNKAVSVANEIKIVRFPVMHSSGRQLAFLCFNFSEVSMLHLGGYTGSWPGIRTKILEIVVDGC